MFMNIFRKLLLMATGLVVFASVPVVGCLAAEMPDLVELNSLSQLYDGVTFDHTLHLDVGADCSACHHHTTGTGVEDERCAKCHDNSGAMDVVACRDCHLAEPFSAAAIHGAASDDLYHIDKPGLKGALHLSCTGCHQEMDGPVGCQDCHERNDSGDAFFNSGSYAPAGIPSGHGH